MPLSLNEIKDRALAFSREWEGVGAERAEAQTFWNEFFNVFGISRRRIASFEEPVRSMPLFENQSAKTGRIDLFWRDTLKGFHSSSSFTTNTQASCPRLRNPKSAGERGNKRGTKIKEKFAIVYDS